MCTHTHTRIPKYAMVGADLPPPEYNRVKRCSQNVFVFVFVIVFVFVFVNFFGHVMSSHHSEQMSQRSQVSRVTL